MCTLSGMFCTLGFPVLDPKKVNFLVFWSASCPFLKKEKLFAAFHFYHLRLFLDLATDMKTTLAPQCGELLYFQASFFPHEVASCFRVICGSTCLTRGSSMESPWWDDNWMEIGSSLRACQSQLTEPLEQSPQTSISGRHAFKNEGWCNADHSLLFFQLQGRCRNSHTRALAPRSWDGVRRSAYLAGASHLSLYLSGVSRQLTEHTYTNYVLCRWYRYEMSANVNIYAKVFAFHPPSFPCEIVERW